MCRVILINITVLSSFASETMIKRFVTNGSFVVFFGKSLFAKGESPQQHDDAQIKTQLYFLPHYLEIILANRYKRIEVFFFILFFFNLIYFEK